MYSIFATVILLSVISSTSLAASNVTIPDDHPLIKYEGRGVRHAPICADGHSEPGCYRIECTPSVTMGQGKDSAASLKFNGSAIYIHSALYVVSPLYSVTLDGKTIEVDGYRRHVPWVCDTLFSQTGLDPNVEHEIRLSIKDVSPSINLTAYPGARDFFEFSLINFIVTTDNPSSIPPNSRSSGGNIGIPGLTTLLSLALLAFH